MSTKPKTKSALKPSYVYVASSWRNPIQTAVCAVLKASGIPHYDFKNPENGTGFSWKEVKSPDAEASLTVCEHCGKWIAYESFTGLGFWEPDLDGIDPTIWRHTQNGYASCSSSNLGLTMASPKKGSDWESIENYTTMVNHPRAIEGYLSDMQAMERADTFVMILPCGKSAHLELGWAAGAGKRTAILMEDPIEPELMYRMCNYLAPSLFDLLGWLGVED